MVFEIKQCQTIPRKGAVLFTILTEDVGTALFAASTNEEAINFITTLDLTKISAVLYHRLTEVNLFEQPTKD